MALSPDQRVLTLEQRLSNQFIARYDGETVHVSFEQGTDGETIRVARNEWGTIIEEHVINDSKENK